MVGQPSGHQYGNQREGCRPVCAYDMPRQADQDHADAPPQDDGLGQFLQRGDDQLPHADLRARIQRMQRSRMGELEQEDAQDVVERDCRDKRTHEDAP